MWFLKFWIVSSLICGCVLYITSRSLTDKFKREGYEINKIKHSIYEKLQTYIYIIIPFFNILMIFICLFMVEKIENKVKEKIVKNQLTI